jgi:DNA-binding NarL/FixJ family response regulator
MRPETAGLREWAGLGRLLASEPGFEVVRECGNSAEALRILSASSVDVVLLDFDHSTIRLLADQSVERFLQLNNLRSASRLTDRAQKVLLGILAGFTNKKIGGNLGLSAGSVKTSVQQLFSRTGVRTRSQLVRAALEGSLGTAKAMVGRTRDSTNA